MVKGKPSATRISLQSARRLAIAKQRLAGERPRKSSPESILDIVRSLGCVQLDPISVVAPSHQLVLWSRLGKFRLSDLDTLLWREKKLFEYWAHQSSIVLMEDYPLFYGMMRAFPDCPVVPPVWRRRMRKWFEEKRDVRKYILGELRSRGPLLSRQFEKPRPARRSFGWSSWNDVSRMLNYMFFRGEVMVVGREGIQKLWGLTEEFIPDWAQRKVIPEDEVEYQAVQRSIKALGVATRSQIKWQFLRRRYLNLDKTIERLEDDSRIRAVLLENNGKTEGPYFIHSDDERLLGDTESGDWNPRTTLLSPFDNLICDRERIETLFGFHYRVEIYTPPGKRKHGYYVLPILCGDGLVGRADLRMDRKAGKLVVEALHAEKDAPRDREAGAEIAAALEDLSGFLGGKEVAYSADVPEFWKGSFR